MAGRLIFTLAYLSVLNSRATCMHLNINGYVGNLMRNNGERYYSPGGDNSGRGTNTGITDDVQYGESRQRGYQIQNGRSHTSTSSAGRLLPKHGQSWDQNYGDSGNRKEHEYSNGRPELFDVIRRPYHHSRNVPITKHTDQVIDSDGQDAVTNDGEEDYDYQTQDDYMRHESNLHHKLPASSSDVDHHQRRVGVYRHEIATATSQTQAMQNHNPDQKQFPPARERHDFGPNSDIRTSMELNVNIRVPNGMQSKNSQQIKLYEGQRQYDVPQIECPLAEDGMEKFACPTIDLQGLFRCIDDHDLCNGFIDCPDGEDEEKQWCMFYKTTKAHLDVLAEAFLRKFGS